MDAPIYSFYAHDAAGQLINMSKYKNKVLLIVNTATQCGFTKQLGALQQLHETYASKGLEVLGFPCNQFGNQEPLEGEAISEFCKMNYGVTFQLFKKIDVGGANASPLFKYLTEKAPGILGSQSIKWNFTKFLVDRTGTPLIRFSPMTAPGKIIPEIERLLKA